MTERQKRELTADRLLYEVTGPINTVKQAGQMSNDAVTLYTKGQMTRQELATFSTCLAEGVTRLGAEILDRPVKHHPHPENKLLEYTATIFLAEKHRDRAIALTNEDQEQALVQAKPKGL